MDKPTEIGAGWRVMAFWATAIVLGLYSFQTYYAFPSGDDFAYAPLAELFNDPELFPGDDQLRSFHNHAWIYNGAYLLAKSSVGVAAGFGILATVLAISGAIALLMMMRLLGAQGLALPISLVLVLMLEPVGIGRGTYGGFIAGFFHHQGVALSLLLWSFVALLASRPVAAGVLLGLTAYAQPVVALHGSLALAFACFSLGRGGIRPLLFVSGSSFITALPAVVITAAALLNKSGGELEVGEAILAYLFRAPHHYSLPGDQLWTGWTWLMISALSLKLLPWNHVTRQVTALLAALALLLLIATLLHHLWETKVLFLYILDFTRSSPLLFAIAAVLVAALCEHVQKNGLPERLIHQVALALTGVLTLVQVTSLGNASAWLLLVIAALVLVFHRNRPPASLIVTGALGLAIFVNFAPERMATRPVAPALAELAAWTQDETPKDALFITPPSMMEFRLLAKRSVYVNFQLFSVAQPSQAIMTRNRLLQITRPEEDTLKARGWAGIGRWDADYAEHNDCSGMRELLTETGAEYLVLAAQNAKDCPPPLFQVFLNEGFAVYHLSGRLTRGGTTAHAAGGKANQ